MFKQVVFSRLDFYGGFLGLRLVRKSVNFDDNGFTGIVGVRFGLSPSYGFRIDGTADSLARRCA